ncbi:MAG: threonylcarbamoyladenosine tRNA methylthiotransferase MtaB [Abditibacteriota bacterium]|nr:threonylcarbamoyladenosine tRNA methylthiotransferase MtaB [Abditibacteriota bacterium]
MSQTLPLLSQAPDWVRQSRQSTLDESGKRAPTFALYTLGCKVNQYDSHQIARLLLREGFRRVEFRESADLYVIDTCTVTNEADRKSRKAAARAQRNNPDSIVAVTGCAATYSQEQFLRVVPDAIVLPNARKFELPDLAIAALQARPNWAQKYSDLRELDAIEPIPTATRERAVLKIQDGCNHKCSYCIIPRVRGGSVQKTRETILNEARAFVREGARELVVTGVSMGDWKGKEEGGRSKDEKHEREASSFRSHGRNHELCSLLRAIATVEGLERIRVSSLDPADVDEEWLQTVAATPKICPQIHLALQSGSASTLRRMRRRYTPELFLKWAKRWREIRPDGGLTSDIIVGFPGETAEEWQETMRVAREAKFSSIHVFPFSPRDDTAAADLPNPVDAATQKRRVDELLLLGAQLSSEFANQFIGHTLPILVETIENGVIEGLTENYLKVRAQSTSARRIEAGDIVSVQVARWENSALCGGF